MARTLFFHILRRKFIENTINKPNFSQYNISFYSLCSDLFSIIARKRQWNQEQCSLCCTMPCFRVLLCTLYGLLRCVSTCFFKSKEIGVSWHIFQDYVISCDYVHTNSKDKEESKNNFLENFWTIIDWFHENFMILNTVKCHYMYTGQDVSDNDTLHYNTKEASCQKCATLWKVKGKLNETKSRYNLYQVMQGKGINTYPCKSKFSHKNGGFKIKKNITKLVMETKIQGKQNHLRKIRKDTRSLTITMK